jgi:DNA-binding MarR family transcriptional regulator
MRFYKLPVGLAADSGLTAAAKIVYAVILDHMGSNGVCWPGHRRLAGQTGLHRDTVADAVESLAGAGWITVEHGDSGRSNHYRLVDQSGRKNQPVDESESGWNSPPAGKTNRPEIPAPGGRKNQPEAAGKTSQNQIDQLNQSTNTGAPAKKPTPKIDWSSLLSGTSLDNPACRQAIDDFAQHRIEIRHALKPTGAKMLVAKLLAWGPDKAFAAIRQSLEQGWQGVFEPGGSKNATQNTGRIASPPGKYDEIMRRAREASAESAATEAAAAHPPADQSGAADSPGRSPAAVPF